MFLFRPDSVVSRIVLQLAAVRRGDSKESGFVVWGEWRFEEWEKRGVIQTGQQVTACPHWIYFMVRTVLGYLSSPPRPDELVPGAKSDPIRYPEPDHSLP
jgi:hypothetical protein